MIIILTTGVGLRNNINILALTSESYLCGIA